jgi:hypothetical protein
MVYKDDSTCKQQITLEVLLHSGTFLCIQVKVQSVGGCDLKRFLISDQMLLRNDRFNHSQLKLNEPFTIQLKLVITDLYVLTYVFGHWKASL